jgi:glutaminase
MLPSDQIDFAQTLQVVHDALKASQEGRVAQYIPELAKADPTHFGLALVDVQGNLHSVGDAQLPFTIQSISKVFVYGMALANHGREEVLARVGVEPTGDPFDSIIRLDENSKRPDNPMVNAGAIATTSLIPGQDPTDKLNQMLRMFSRYIGRQPMVDMAVFMSERTTGHRNRAMAHLMRHFGMLGDRIDEVLDLYFQQCSVLVTCEDLAMMAATLANRGVNPKTRERAVESAYVKDILSVMYTCGMYNYAGQWAYTVGLPAKSGVSGGIIAVVPGQFGLAVFSPPLDSNGNSVRGIQASEALSRCWGLHIFDCSAPDCG